MSKRIIYKKCVYERVADFSKVDKAQIDAISKAVFELAREMSKRSNRPIRDEIVEVLGGVKDNLFEKIPPER